MNGTHYISEEPVETGSFSKFRKVQKDSPPDGYLLIASKLMTMYQNRNFTEEWIMKQAHISFRCESSAEIHVLVERFPVGMLAN